MSHAQAPEIWKTLRDRIEGQYRNDMAALARLMQMAEEDGTRGSNLMGRSMDARTHFDLLVEMMRTAPDRWWSVAELAEATGLTQSAIRTVAYTKNDAFEKDETRPKRIRWRLKETVAA